MSNRDILELCFGNLLRRKTRTVLAIVGVIVGVCAIVVMVSIGFGLSESFSSQIEGYGNLHIINVYNYGGGTSKDGKSYKLNDSTVQKLEHIDGVTAVTPLLSQYVTIGIGHMKTSTELTGINPEFFEKINLDIEEGRSLTNNDKNGLLFGHNVACWFYNPRQSQGYDWSNTEPTVDVITKDIIVTGDYNWGTNQQGEGDYSYEDIDAQGIGLIAGLDNDYSYNVYANIDFVKDVKNSIAKSEKQQSTASSQLTYDSLWVYVSDTTKISDISKSIKEDYGFYTYSLQDMIDELNQMMKMIELVLGGIGAVSLLVAAIGIANTMIMSVYERTREIGVMKVIGASLTDIRKMFLLEAGMIGFGGGLFGLGLSFGVSALGNKFLGPMMESSIGIPGAKLSVIPWWLAIGALAFATLVGIISGYYPANRATKLSALEGLKNE